MRRSLSVVILLLLLLGTCFAYDEVGQFDFKAYYNGRRVNDEYLYFEIYANEAETIPVGLNGTVLMSNQGTITDVEVFRWRIFGNTEKQVYLKFAFTPLQGSVGDTYYIPQHTFTITPGTPSFDALQTEGYDVTISTSFKDSTSDVVFGYKASGSRPYPGKYSSIWTDRTPLGVNDNGYLSVTLYSTYMYYKDEVLTSIPTDSSNSDYQLYRADWSLPGVCTLTVSSYDKPEDEFEYSSEVIVTIWVD